MTAWGWLMVTIVVLTAGLLDCRDRRIPAWLGALALGGALLGAWFDAWSWFWLGAGIGAGLVWVSGFPGGDVKLMGIVIGLLPYEPAIIGLGFGLAITGAVFRLNRSLVGLPWFFPLSAGPVLSTILFERFY